MKRENYTRSIKTCPCGLEFTPSGQNQKYCTLTCQKEFNKERNKESYIKYLLKNGHKVGVGKGGTTGSGKQNHMYKHGLGVCLNQRAETKAKQRYCGHCGKDLIDATHYQWGIHHIDHNRYNNPEDGSNWVLLCKRCHQIEHKCWDALEGATTSLVRLSNGRYSNPNKRSSQESSEMPNTLTNGLEG